MPSPIVADYVRTAYLRMSLAVEVEGVWTPAYLAVERLSPPLTIITATNQWIDRLPLPVQARRYSDLEQEFLNRGLVPRPASAMSPGSDRVAKAWAVEGLGPRAARKVGRKLDKGVVFQLTATKQQVLGCSFPWTLERGIVDTPPPAPGGPNLAEAVLETLNVRVTPHFKRASLQGWGHEGKLEYKCPECANELHVFGADLTSRDKVPYRATAFLCASCATIRIPPDMPAGCRELVARRRMFCTASHDADQAHRSERSHWAYVIELSDAIGPREGELPWVYVGQTSTTPEIRFDQHKAGIKASRHVREPGLRLRRDLYEDQPVLRTSDEARTYEAYLYSRLSAEGYPVKGGQ